MAPAATATAPAPTVSPLVSSTRATPPATATVTAAPVQPLTAEALKQIIEAMQASLAAKETSDKIPPQGLPVNLKDPRTPTQRIRDATEGKYVDPEFHEIDGSSLQGNLSDRERDFERQSEIPVDIKNDSASDVSTRSEYQPQSPSKTEAYYLNEGLLAVAKAQSGRSDAEIEDRHCQTRGRG